MSHAIEDRIIETLQQAIANIRIGDIPKAIERIQEARDTALKLDDHYKMLSQLPKLRSKSS